MYGTPLRCGRVFVASRTNSSARDQGTAQSWTKGWPWGFHNVSKRCQAFTSLNERSHLYVDDVRSLRGVNRRTSHPPASVGMFQNQSASQRK